jgi:hypothetical protein
LKPFSVSDLRYTILHDPHLLPASATIRRPTGQSKCNGRPHRPRVGRAARDGSGRRAGSDQRGCPTDYEGTAHRRALTYGGTSG